MGVLRDPLPRIQMPTTFNIITGVGKEITVDDVDTMGAWGSEVFAQIAGIQDANKYWRENQQGMGKKPGYVDHGRMEARIPLKLMLAYEKAHPDFDYNDDKSFYKFLDAHPEFDTRPKREAQCRS